MKKQVQLILSAISIVLTSLTAYGQQSVGDQFPVDDIKYEITSPTEVKVVGYTGTATEVTIPSTVKDQNDIEYTVTAIGGGEAANQQPFRQKGLTSVSIPSTVTSIGIGAFNSNRLTEVTIPNGVTNIPKWAFAQNDLRELAIPASVEHIGFQAFFRNNNLSIVTVERIPATTIHATAFQDAGFYVRPGKIDLVVPFGSIQDYKDAGWMVSEFGTITSGITIIDGIKYGITTFPHEATVVGNIGNDYNLSIPPRVDIGGITYPVTAIGDGALPNAGVKPLLTVIIPETVRSIGFQAFYGSSLNRVTVEAHEPPTLDPNAFEYPQRHDKINLAVPKGREQAYKDAGWTGFRSISSILGQLHKNSGFHWRVTSLWPNEMELEFYEGPYDNGHLEIPSEVEYWSVDNSTTEAHGTYLVTSIGKAHLGGWWRHGNSRLTSVEIPTSVTHIGDSAFTLSQLTEIDIPDAVTHIGQSAFAQSQLTEVVIPDAVTHIGESAFAHNQLASVEIPASVTHIGEHAFEQNQLTHVTTPGNVNTIRRWTYASNQLTEVTISGNVTDIELYAFLDNPDLRLVTVEANDPPKLHKDAFSNAYRDQIDLVVPIGIGTKQAYLDNGWDGFRSISFGTFTVDGIKYGITSLSEVMVVDYAGTATGVTIPGTVEHGAHTYEVTAIGEFAFQNNELASIEIPAGITSIGKWAFSNNHLTEISLPGSVERIGRKAFYNNPGLALVTVEANDPPELDAIAFAKANRHQIALLVPEGRAQAYEDNGWGGFKSISGGGTPPQPTIDAPQSVDNLEFITVNITFDGEVTDFGLEDIQLANATVNTFTGSGSTYTATLAPTSFCDDITIDVPANVATGVNSLPNRAATQVIVAVVDAIDPTIACPADVVANTSDDGTGDCTTTVDLGNPVTDDNCSVATIVAQVNGMEIDPDTYAFGTGITTVTWIVSDDTGNTASCEQTVTVHDDEGPMAIVKDITVQLDAGGQVTISPDDVDDGSGSGCDHTGPVSLSLDRNVFTCDDVGIPITVTLIATYDNNSDLATATVTVEAAGNCGLAPLSTAMIPTAFTPNGDGANDTWIIDDLSEGASVRIYDRHGTIIYSSDDGYTRPWDGTSHGRSLPAGSYLYLIQTGRHTYRGRVTILL